MRLRQCSDPDLLRGKHPQTTPRTLAYLQIFHFPKEIYSELRAVIISPLDIITRGFHYHIILGADQVHPVEEYVTQSLDPICSGKRLTICCTRERGLLSYTSFPYPCSFNSNCAQSPRSTPCFVPKPPKC